LALTLLERLCMARRFVRDYVSVTAVAMLLATGACGNSGPAPAAPSTSVAPAPAPNPSPAPQPETPVLSFGAGQHRVGLAISPGRYFTDPSPGCLWERQAATGAPAERIASAFVSFDASQVIVDIAAGDYAFTSNEACGTWSNRPRAGLHSELSPGAWLVGAQALPSLYRAAASPGCYWERLRDFGGSPNSVIARELVGRPEPIFVTIAADDAGFSATAECGSWIRIDTATSK
jgi:hypothetical protein